MELINHHKVCLHFEPNIFNKSRCQHCFRVKEQHQKYDYIRKKMARKTLACGFLYVAPSNLDFSQPNHSSKRWQRRWFSLYDDGEFIFALDENPDTVPQLRMDMNKCIRVCCADAITQHAHSLLLAFSNSVNNENSHPAVCYIKADNTEEIRCWENVLQTFSNQNTIQITPSCSFSLDETHNSEPLSGDILLPPDCANYGYAIEHTDIHPGDESDAAFSNTIGRNSIRNDEEPKQVPDTFKIDTSNVYTLRKGWLTLRGKSENQYQKYWVVLAGLSLKLYNDVWVDDNAEPAITIDLSECENVYPSTRNYGIEIKCKRARYVLSAMTPGIRDSWISALQQNLHNPSPNYLNSMDNADAATHDSTEIFSFTKKRKHIAYVAPESHHSNSVMDGELSSTTDENDEENLTRLESSQRNGTREDSRFSDLLSSTVDGISPADILSPSSRAFDSESPLGDRVSILRSQPVSTSPNGTSSFITNVNDQVRTLRAQLAQTISRLKEVENENFSLRTLFPSPEVKKDGAVPGFRFYGEMDVLHPGYPRTHNEGPLQLSVEISRRLVSLLKVQVGALSKVLHSTQNATSFIYLRRYVDSLIRTVAGMDENVTQDLATMERTFEGVISAYDKLSSVIGSTDSSNRAENNDGDDLRKEIQALEAEIEIIQAEHGEQLKQQLREFEKQSKILDDRIRCLEAENDDLKNCIQRNGSSTLEESIEKIKSSYQKIMQNLKQEYEENIKKIDEHHTYELEEEKQATKIALDVVQRAHDEEIRRLREERHHQNCCCNQKEEPCKEVMQMMRNELLNVKNLYSSKCTENARLEEEMASLKSLSRVQIRELKSENEYLRSEIRMKEQSLMQLRRSLEDKEKEQLPLKIPKRTASLSTGSLNKTELSPSTVPDVSQTTEDVVLRPPIRKVNPNRRNDVRYFSNPIIPILKDINTSANAESRKLPESLMSEVRRSLAVPVSERRKFFERVAEYNGSF
uniref:Protein outspread n=1 Tax=Bursaphelenchus xylophilus TaxID=6326 RepID=A0A1I7SDS3_BURXY